MDSDNEGRKSYTPSPRGDHIDPPPCNLVRVHSTPPVALAVLAAAIDPLDPLMRGPRPLVSHSSATRRPLPRDVGRGRLALVLQLTPDSLRADSSQPPKATRSRSAARGRPTRPTMTCDRAHPRRLLHRTHPPPAPAALPWLIIIAGAPVIQIDAGASPPIAPLSAVIVPLGRRVRTLNARIPPCAKRR